MSTALEWVKFGLWALHLVQFEEPPEPARDLLQLPSLAEILSVAKRGRPMNPWAVIDQVRAGELAGELQQLEQLYPRFAFTLRGQWWCARNKRTGLELLRLSRAALERTLEQPRPSTWEHATRSRRLMKVKNGLRRPPPAFGRRT